MLLCGGWPPISMNASFSKNVLRVADTYDYLYKPCPDQPPETATAEEKAAWKAEYKKHSDVACIMLGKMSPALQRQSLNKDFGDFVRNFNMHCVGKTVSDLHALLIDYEKGLKDKVTPTPQVKLVPLPLTGHWKRNCPLYLEELRANKKKSEHSAADLPILADRLQKLQREGLFGKHVSRKGASYFLTFTDDFSRYGYVYLLKHKHEVFETFKVFKAEVELQLGKKIKALRSDRGGEYLSQDYGRSMFNLTTLPLSFWDYAYRIQLYGVVRRDVKRDSVIKSQNTRSVSVSLYSGRDCDLEDDHIDTLPSENTSEIPVEPESLGPPPELIPVHLAKWMLQTAFLNGRLDEESFEQTRRQASYSSLIQRFDEKSNGLDLFTIMMSHVYIAKASGVIWEKAYMKRVPYASAVGSIMYAVRCTRPDVAFAQNLVSRYQQNPGKLHWVAVKHILKFCDASWQCDKDDTKSQTGYVFVVNGGAVDWKSKKQTTIAMHATQSEYMAASEAAMEAVWHWKSNGIHDYVFEESVCLLLTASWFHPLHVENHEVVDEHVQEDSYPYGYDEDLDEVYLGRSSNVNIRIGNRRWGNNGFVRAGKQEARPVHQQPQFQDSGAGSSSREPEKREASVAKDTAAVGRRAKRNLKREAADKAVAAKHQQHLVRLGRN
ncbi:retrotransposon protein, putative, ty1-copia subclass [Tanacetum coccineum]